MAELLLEGEYWTASARSFIDRFVNELERFLTISRNDCSGSPGATLEPVNSRTIVKQVLVQGDRVMKPADGVTVLIYHRVGGGSGGEVDLDVDAFRAQLEHLRDHHTVIDLDRAATILSESAPGSTAGEGPAALPQRAVVVTFDDGTDDFVDVVVPALVEYGIPATLYVATHFIDSGEAFPWGAPPASWAGLRDAAATRLVTIGSHTHTHALLDRADPTEIGAELDRSIELIGEHTGTPPAHFAYPKALPGSEAAEAEVRSRFTTAALARSRVNEPGTTDLHRIWRTPIQRSDGHDFFVAKAAGGLRLEGELRELIARVKYRGATR
jgi:peptidoglycan/xylan/chitin deacetylase (PgdA/CDA1 family)